MTSLDLTTSNNFIKDAVIDHVLKDLNINLTDLLKLDQHAMGLFEYLCVCKESEIRMGVVS